MFKKNTKCMMEKGQMILLQIQEVKGKIIASFQMRMKFMGNLRIQTTILMGMDVLAV